MTAHNGPLYLNNESIFNTIFTGQGSIREGEQPGTVPSLRPFIPDEHCATMIALL